MVAANGARFHVAEPATARWCCCCTASRSSGGPGGTSCRRSPTAGYRAAAMDLRGYGASDKPPRGYDPRTLAADVAGVIRSLGERGRGRGRARAGRRGRVDHRGPAPEAGTPGGRRVDAPPAPAAGRPPARPAPAAGEPARPRLPAAVLPERQLVAHDGQQVGRPAARLGGPGLARPGGRGALPPGGPIPGVAHCSLESYRWAVRSIPAPTACATPAG